MRRPSYLQQVAALPPRRGVVVLAPPRIAFRPGVAEFTVEEARATAGASAREGLRPAPALGAAPIPSRAVEIANPAPAEAAPTVQAPREQPTPYASPGTRVASAATESNVRAPQAAGTPVTPPAQPPVARAATGAPAPAAAPSPRSIAPTPAEPSLAQPRRPASAETPATPREVRPAQPAAATAPPAQSAAAPLEPPTPPPPLATRSAPPREVEPPPAASASPQAVQPLAPSAAPPPPSVTPAAAMPVVTPPPPPPRAPAPATRERATPGLHIGTLEVRIVAPAPPPAPLPAPRPAPSRAAARAPAARTGGIARGFGVFGLGQS